jgi:hypothetical protein
MVNQSLNRSMMKIRHLLFIAIIAIAGCKERDQSNNNKNITAFTGATLIDGSGEQPISEGVLLIENGRVLAAGSKETVTIP